MFTIDLTLKNMPFPLSVQRKSPEDAEALYQQIMTAMRSGHPDIVELTCDRQTEKKVAIRSSEISGVQISQKAGTSAASGRPPGFFALAE
ncbi:MAG: hypothetical protein JO235_13540 [Chroococcidiopsidaceae cyanobacterium CP_BM_RX_35]|nr:hypothetical protein [Chroococcidiopsidaceae cyanobacterium CP_BM_RX_35]